MHKGLGEHGGKMHAYALMCAAAKGVVAEGMILELGALGGKPVRVKGLWIGPESFVEVLLQRPHPDHGVSGNAVPGNFALVDGAPGKQGYRRSHTQRLFEYHVCDHHFIQVFIVQIILAQGQRLFAYALLPLRVDGGIVNQVVQHTGGGVVGGKQQERALGNKQVIRVVFAVFHLCVTDIRKRIGPVCAAPLGYLRREVLPQIALAPFSPFVFGAWNLLANLPHQTVIDIHKSLVYARGFLAQFDPDKHFGANFQQRLLDVGGKLKVLDTIPLLDIFLYDGVHDRDIIFHGGGLEGGLHHATQDPVFVKVLHQDATLVELADRLGKSHFSGEIFIRIQQDFLQGIGPGDQQAALVQHLEPRHVAPFFMVFFKQLLQPPYGAQTVAEIGDAVTARNMIQVLTIGSTEVVLIHCYFSHNQYLPI